MPGPRLDEMDPWEKACLALAVFSVDPRGTGGLWLRARPGPVLDAFMARLAGSGPIFRRLHPGIGDEALLGGLDLASTLSTGQVVRRQGLLSGEHDLQLVMAERCPERLAALLGAARDGGGPALLVCDEGIDEEAPPQSLVERVGLFVCLDGISRSEMEVTGFEPQDIGRAQEARRALRCSPDQLDALVLAAGRLGIGSLRAPLFAARAAESSAALFGRERVSSEDLSIAAALVYGHRATRAPEDTTPDSPEVPPEPAADERCDRQESEATEPRIPDELLVEAALAALPPDLLASLARGRAARGAKGTSGAGAKRRGNRRGRPLPSRPGLPDGQSRIDLVATLRAAAPWQTVRRQARPDHPGLHIRKADIRLRRFEEPSDRLLVFAVDASGSAAMARLAETKGAIELLLGEAYARRDHVALIAFRGDSAETLLAPTRSLVQTKRRLQALPGGGGTPLAAGLMAALETSHHARARGMTPTIALLTDGRGNIALDGQANRGAATADAEKAARLIRASGIPALVIDTAHRPQPALASLSGLLSGTYLALPRADARRLTDAVLSASN